MRSLDQEISTIKQDHENWLGKAYSQCTPAELKLVLDNLESQLSPECLSDYFRQTGYDPDLKRKAIRQIWMEIESKFGITKAITHKW